MHTFETPSPTGLQVTNGGGRVTVEAADTTESTVTLTAMHPEAEQAVADATVEQRGAEIVVQLPRGRSGLFRSRQPRVAVDAVVPTGSRLRTDLESADLRTVGALSDVRAKLGSGDTVIDAVTDSVRVDSGSGDIQIDRCDGKIELGSGSGDITIDTARETVNTRCGSGDVSIRNAEGQVTAKSGSGDVVVQSCAAGLNTKTGSGDVRVAEARAGEVTVHTASGDVQVAVPQGTATWLDLNTVSGDVHSDLDSIESPDNTDETLELRVRTASGDIAASRA